VNSYKLFCLDMSSHWDVLTCDDEASQDWARVLCSDDACTSFSLSHTADDSKCLGTVADSGEGSTHLSMCADTNQQTWSFKPANWETPVGSWTSKGCNAGGSVAWTVEVGITQGSSTEVTEETAVEVGVEIDTGFLLKGSKVTGSWSSSLATTWSSSAESSKSESIKMTCDYYPDGTAFTSGCMWQFNLKVDSFIGEDSIEWKAPLVACTADETAPTCPPFSVCADDSCSQCTDAITQGTSFSSTAKSFSSAANSFEELHV